MIPLAALTLATLLTASCPADEATFYLGTYTRSGQSEGIYVGRLDTGSGHLGPVELAGEAKSPSYVALSPDQKFLYAAIEDGGGMVGAFHIGLDGRLTFLNSQPTGGAGACHVWVDATGRNVLAANYGGGSIANFQTKPDGSLAERTAFVQLEGSGPDVARQQEPHAHSIYTDPTNRFVYACDLGADQVWIFHFDARTGALSPATPPSAKAPPGGGPRHLALHPRAPFAYVNNEMGLSVTAFACDLATGALTALQALPTMPEGAGRKGVTTAEIVVHPGGHWLYVSNRGDDTISVFAIGPDGRLAWLENAPAQVQVPRGFGIDPTGRWLITAGQKDNRIAVLKIDPATGRLSATDQSARVGSPVCVLFAPLK